tara:strand:- start:127 stop:849 length:723 start_codon:yes stop_codon:yes gene_type:complete
MTQSQILLIEDEPHLAYNIEFNLKAEGYAVVVATSGKVGLEMYRSHGPFDVVILDVMLPEVSGFQIAENIRKKDKTTGILILTARSEEEDIMNGLALGADDYVTKPFHLKELLLRVRRMAERSSLIKAETQRPSKVKSIYKDTHFDPETLELVTSDGRSQLTVLEAKVLKEFLCNENKILSREHLLNQVWGIQGNVETRTVDNFILRLRKYLEKNPSKPQIILSVRGRGYIYKGPKHHEG